MQAVAFIDQDRGYPERCPACSRKHAYATKNHEAWNKGLTKETDERMAASAANMHKHYIEYGHHNTGKTKENDEGVRQKGFKISEALRAHYAEHEGWSLGMTKETSSIIANRGKNISIALKGRIFGDDALEKMRLAKLLTHDVVQRRLREKNIELTSDYVDTVTRTNLRCLKCDTTFERHVGAIFNNNARCPTCFPPWANKTSAWQQEVADFVATLVTDVEINNRVVVAPLELDVYVPSHKFAIECNGLYWHSEAAKRFKSDHVEEKRLLAKEAGVNLLIIFEDEWRDKRHVVESMIAHRLGRSTSIGARELCLQRCQQSNVASLLEKWHLEGHVNSSHAMKLVTNTGDVVGACSLRWARGTNRTVLEIARIAFLPGIHVQGGVGRFVKESLRWTKELGATRLLTYSDNRLGNGSGYSAAGLRLDGTTVPRFWWTDNVVRYDRFKYRANKERCMSEKQVAQEAGVFRVYGCSNTRWVADV